MEKRKGEDAFIGRGNKKRVFFLVICEFENLLCHLLASFITSITNQCHCLCQTINLLFILMYRWLCVCLRGRIPGMPGNEEKHPYEFKLNERLVSIAYVCHYCCNVFTREALNTNEYVCINQQWNGKWNKFPVCGDTKAATAAAALFPAHSWPRTRMQYTINSHTHTHTHSPS